MHLTQYTDYSLRILLYLGFKQKRATISEISNAFKVSRHHLTKVAHDLARRRYVHTFPGKFGGLELAEAACNLKLGEMIKQFEPMTLLECFDPVTNTCPLQGVCQLERALYESRQAFLEALNRYTLGDFLKPGASLAQRKARLRL